MEWDGIERTRSTSAIGSHFWGDRLVKKKAYPRPDRYFTQQLPLGFELHMGKERCCLQGLDHLNGPTFHSICGNLMIYKPSLTSDRLMFEHDESLRADSLPIHFPPHMRMENWSILSIGG
ncbi:unnamed protein product [Withania somnifera]